MGYVGDVMEGVWVGIGVECKSSRKMGSEWYGCRVYIGG